MDWDDWKVKNDARTGSDRRDTRRGVGRKDYAAEIDAEIKEWVMGAVEVGAEGAAIHARGVGGGECRGGEAGVDAELSQASSGGEEQESEERSEFSQDVLPGPRY
jgi:hypothetical protein